MIFGIGNIYGQLVWPLDSGKTSPWAFSQLIDAHVDLKQCFFRREKRKRRNSGTRRDRWDIRDGGMRVRERRVGRQQHPVEEVRSMTVKSGAQL